jgi:hypothetical protein
MQSEPMITLTPNHYKDAIMVQDACNLTGVLHSFIAVATIAKKDPSISDPTRHPVMVMYAHKVASLVGRECLCEGCINTFAEAYNFCKKQTGEGHEKA